MSPEGSATADAQTEEWRRFQAGHVERQTKALESIKASAAWLLILFAIQFGLVILFAAFAQRL